MKEKERISILEPGVLILGLLLAILSAAICMQIMGQFGTTPNTSLISAVLVMVVARIPITVAQRFRNLERQNYVLSIASAAGFSAANSGFVAIAIMFVMGRDDLIIPMAFGSLIGSMISVFATGRLYDSKIFPVKGSWPLGTAIANSLEAGDEGGNKTQQLLQGLIVGAIASIFRIPAAGVGIAFIANMISMVALASGMIVRGYSASLFNGFDLGRSNIAQGVMIGAGIVAFGQIFLAIAQDSKKPSEGKDKEYTVSDAAAIKTLIDAAGLFMGGAMVTALIMGVFGEMNLTQSVLWVLFAGIGAIVIIILVGTASMHSGWAPNFAVVTICLTVGLLLGFPPLPLAILMGYLGSIGLCISDTGIGLKSGWLIRGKGTDRERELYGRRQQILIKQLGVIIGIGMAVFFGVFLMRDQVVPPMSIFYANTVGETVDGALLRELALWALPGAALQVIFGNKSVGLMLATGLLINNPLFGISVLVAVCVRLLIGTKHMNVRAPGLIAGDGLLGFAVNVIRALSG